MGSGFSVGESGWEVFFFVLFRTLENHFPTSFPNPQTTFEPPWPPKLCQTVHLGSLIEAVGHDATAHDDDMDVLHAARRALADFKDGRQTIRAAAPPTGDAVPVPLACSRSLVRVPGVMCTYNNDFLADGKDSGEVMEMLRSFLLQAQVQLGFRRFSATMEISLRSHKTVTLAEVFGSDSLPDDDFQRVHIHAFLDWPTPEEFDPSVLKEQLAFMSAYPHMHFTATRGRGLERSLQRSHFYVRAEKVGTLHFIGNYFPWTEWAPGGVGNYRPDGKWIDDLWSEHKLSNSVYLKYAELVRVDFPKRRSWHDAVMAQVQTRKMETEAARRETLLQAAQCPWREIPEVGEWKASYEGLRTRYNILVIRAGSKSGKTEFAKSLFPTVWEQVVEDLPAPNLRTFHMHAFDAILFDNVNAASFILDNRGLLMARNTVHHLAQTATGLFTYPRFLHRVPIMVTMDVERNWPDSDWFKANCIVVTVPQGEKLFVQRSTYVQDSCLPRESFRLVSNWAQRNSLSLQATFSSAGPRHAELWKCTLQIRERTWEAVGESSKKMARQVAATKAWSEIQAQS